MAVWLLGPGTHFASTMTRAQPLQAGLLGLARTVRAEKPDARLSHLDGAGTSTAELLQMASSLPSSESEAVLCSGAALTRRTGGRAPQRSSRGPATVAVVGLRVAACVRTAAPQRSCAAPPRAIYS